MFQIPHQLRADRRVVTSIITEATSIFDLFDGPPLAKLDFIFCFVGIILFFLLLGPALRMSAWTRGRERVACIMLAVSALFFAVNYGIAFANYAEGPFVYDTLSEDGQNALGGIGFQAYIIAASFLLCALLFLSNCTFDYTQGTNQKFGLPRRMWAMILVGVYFGFATIENILGSTLLSVEENTDPEGSQSALLAQDRAVNGFFILERLSIFGISVFLFICCFMRSRGGPGHKVHIMLRWVISPLLIAGTLVGLAFAIASVIVFNQLVNAVADDQINQLINTQNEIDVGDRITQIITMFLVILLAISGVLSALSDVRRGVQHPLEQPIPQTGYQGPCSYYPQNNYQQHQPPPHGQQYFPYMNQQPMYPIQNPMYPNNYENPNPGPEMYNNQPLPQQMGYSGAHNTYQNSPSSASTPYQQTPNQLGSPYQHPTSTPSHTGSPSPPIPPPIVTDG